MARLVKIAVVAAIAAAVAHYLYDRDEAVPATGNGHSSDADRTAMLKQRIAAARKRLRDEPDSVRGE
jgi:hypothetical protein